MTDETKKEPTTAELFSTARDGIHGRILDITADGAISELERRMGAMERAMEEARDLLGETSDNATKAWRMLNSALTGAPPVSPVGSTIARAVAELRHAYRDGVRDWRLVARAIALLESATTPGAAPLTGLTIEEVEAAFESVRSDGWLVTTTVKRLVLERLAALRGTGGERRPSPAAMLAEAAELARRARHLAQQGGAPGRAVHWIHLAINDIRDTQREAARREGSK